MARLDGIGTVASRFTITPFVGFLAGRPMLVPEPGEVVRVLEVPLSELLDPRRLPRGALGHVTRADFDVHFFDLADETVWGATARILTDLLTRLVTARADPRAPDRREAEHGHRRVLLGRRAAPAFGRARVRPRLERRRTDGARCSWVEDTGELYLMREPNAGVWGDGAGDLRCVPVSEHALGVEVLGVVSRACRDRRVMSGWDQAMNRPDGIAWLRDRVAHADEHANDSPATPSQVLPDDK